MSKLRNFLKKHVLIAGGVAVLIPLTVIFYLQYRMLKTLGETLPAYRTQVLNQHLRGVTEEVMDFYMQHAERVLKVPAQDIDFYNGGIIKDNKSGTASLKAVARIADHFKQQDFRGARRYFIAVATEYEGDQRSEVFFYDPLNQAMIADPKSPELVAINVACASYMVYIRSGSFISPYAVGVDRNPQYRIMVKPVYIQDESRKEVSQKILAVAGMVMDYDFLLKTLLPEAIRNSTLKYLPVEDRNALVAFRGGGHIIALYDGMGNTLEIPSGNALGESEAFRQLSYIFANHVLTIRLKYLTVKQWSRRNFIINLSLWTLMTLLLLAAIGLMLRTASREIKLTQMKADFVSNVSHELRTPLASIRVLAELLNLGRVKDPTKVLEYGGYIESEGRRLTQLINNILDFSRIESGGKTYHFETANVKEVITDALEAFSLQLKRNGFVVDFEAADKSLSNVTLDPDAFGLALTNLFDNAIKYSGSEKKISVRLDQTDGFVTIAIRDHGIGIPREEQVKIFEKFYRVSTGLVHDVKGSGLGLSLVKHIVEAHHGKITVDSTPGKGSTFTIFLPTSGHPDGDTGSKFFENQSGNGQKLGAGVKI
jgi:signal transduction histidine kinase